MKGPTENRTQTASPIEGQNLTRIGESVTEHRAGSGRAHKGLDLFAPAGSPVLSAVSGKVLRVVDGSTSSRSSGQRAGWFVDILGSDGLIYRYLHLAEKPTVRAHQAIRAGTQLGTVGMSGIQRSGPHVHFEIRKGDYSSLRRNYGEPVDPLTVLPLHNLTQGRIRMADANSQAGGAGPSAAYKPAAIDLNAPDAQAALAFLVSKGWTQDEVELLLNKHAEIETTNRQVEEHLLSLGWSRSDIARLLVGPEKSHLTAEALFSQHAANSAADQEALRRALAQAGAQDIKPDPSLLSGLNPAHLSPDSPSDLDQLISQFAELPDVQKRRFLLLLEAQKPSKQTVTPKPEVGYTQPKRAGRAADDDSPKSSGPAGDVLPIVKSSLDLLSTALKGLLGTPKEGSKKGANGSGQRGSWEDSTADESDDEDPSSRTDDDTDEDDADSIDDVSGTDDEIDLSSEPDEPIDAANEREPD